MISCANFIISFPKKNCDVTLWWWNSNKVGQLLQGLAEGVVSQSSNNSVIVWVHLKFRKERTRLEQGKNLQVWNERHEIS
jgi:hypothetical protein